MRSWCFFFLSEARVSCASARKPPASRRLYTITTTWHRSWEIAGVTSPPTTLEYHPLRARSVYLIPAEVKLNQYPHLCERGRRIALFRREEWKKRKKHCKTGKKTVELTVFSLPSFLFLFRSQKYRNLARWACECVPETFEDAVLGWTRGRVMEDVII